MPFHNFFVFVYKHQYVLSLTLVVAGLIGLTNVSSESTLEMFGGNAQPKQDQSQTVRARNLDNIPTHISIGEHIAISIVEGKYDQGTWSIPEEEAAFLSSAAIPGEQGNIIVYGHNFWNIFGRLQRTKVGDIVSITTAGDRLFEYQVIEVKHITTERLEYLQPTTSELLTIYTCSGWLDQDRFLVRAVPV